MFSKIINLIAIEKLKLKLPKELEKLSWKPYDQDLILDLINSIIKKDVSIKIQNNFNPTESTEKYLFTFIISGTLFTITIDTYNNEIFDIYLE